MLDKIETFIEVSENQKELLVKDFLKYYQHGQIFSATNQLTREEFYIFDKENSNPILIPIRLGLEYSEDYYRGGVRGVNFDIIKDLVEVHALTDAIKIAKDFRKDINNQGYTGLSHRFRKVNY